MAKKTSFKKKYISMLANARANSKARKAKRHHRGNGGGGKVGLNVAGLKRVASNSVLAVVGALAARAAYGLLVKAAPDLDDKVRVAGGIALPIIGGIALSGKLPVAMAITNGALGIAAADMAGEMLGDTLADYPEVANAMVSGIGYAGKLALAPVPVPLGPPTPVLTGGAATAVIPAGVPAADGTITGWPRYDGLGEVDFLPEESSRLW